MAAAGAVVTAVVAGAGVANAIELGIFPFALSLSKGERKNTTYGMVAHGDKVFRILSESLHGFIVLQTV